MNYYPFHVGDYRSDTSHLSLLEHGIYRQLIDWYYLDEHCIPAETQLVFRRLQARTDEEKFAVQTVLDEFFRLTPEGYSHSRCDAEIVKYQSKAEVARSNGKSGGRPKKTESVISGLPQETGSKANQEPRTNNQEPLTKEKRERSPSGSRLPADWVIPFEWQEWAKAERPDLQITSVVCQFHDFWIAKAGKEGRKADWAATWRNWVRNQRAPAQTGQQGSGETAYQRSMRERVAELAPGIARRSPSQLKPVPFAEEIFDVPVITSR